MKLPEKFYVTRNYRSTEEVLGFMVVADAEHTKAVQKRKETADKWARGSKLGPIYVDNIPKTGFQVVTNQSRYSTSNVVWRVYHPEGFEFEITSDNFMDLIQTSTIVEGAIEEELFFTQNRKLVSTKTKLFADEIKREEEKAKQEELISEFKEGDLFEFDGDMKTKACSSTFKYCGKYHVLVMNKNKPLSLPEKSSKKEVVQCTQTGRYFIRSKVSPYPITKVGTSTVDREQVVNDLNTSYRDVFKTNAHSYHTMEDHYHLFVAGNDKPFKRTDCVVEYTDVDPRTIREHIDEYFAYFENNGKIHRIFGAYKTQQGYYRSGDLCQTESFHAAEGMFSYPAVLDENGHLVIDGIDLSEHQGFSGWRAKSPFSLNNRYSTDAKALSITQFKNAPPTIKFGKVKIGK